MAGLPVSLAIAIWFVAALWIVGAVGYYFDYSAEFIWLTPFLAMGVALANGVSPRIATTQTQGDQYAQ